MLMGKNGCMSNIFGAPKAGGPSGPDDARTVPTGDTVGSYTSYLDAQKAVDYLADQQFPVQMVSIVGNELKMVERVTGRLTYPRVALSGALSGMWFGLFVGVMLSFFAPSPGYFSILASVLMGAAFFMLFGIVTYAMQRGKRDFTSTSQVVATSYDVVVSVEAAHDARRLLQQLPMTRSDAAAGPYNPQGYQNQQYGQTGQTATWVSTAASRASRAISLVRHPHALPVGMTPTDSRVPELRARGLPKAWSKPQARTRARSRRQRPSRRRLPLPPSATRTSLMAGRSTVSASQIRPLQARPARGSPAQNSPAQIGPGRTPSLTPPRTPANPHRKRCRRRPD
ncbi:hypothetical protein AHiyo4_33830 [Arthrobacter sp. Hiyo4]|nr:hypothetical protein AHiyo4_33830 [Arthrobacter sp. Hiyo4]